MRLPSLLRFLPFLAAVAGASGAATEVFPGEGAKWRHLQSPHFELYSGAGEGESRELLRSLELLRAAFLVSFRLEERRPLPVTVFYFGRERDFRAYVPAADRKNDRFAGFYVGRADRATILMVPREDEADARRTIYHEYVHHLMKVTEENPPPWFNEGIAELFSTIEEERDFLRIGRAIPRRIAELQQARLMPLEELFAVKRDSPVFREGRHMGLFYAQSWALLHFCHLGISDLPKDRLDRFLDAARSPSLADDPGKLRELARDFLGMDLRELNEKIGSYARGGRYKVGQMPKPVIEEAKTYAIRPASADEMRLRLAELEARVNRTGRAKLVLLDASERNPTDARLHETLGMLALYDGDEIFMRERWNKAIEAGSTNPAIYHELGQRESRRWFQRFDLYFRLADDTAARLRDLLKRSIAAAPHQTAAYEMLAWVEATAKVTDPANVNLVQTQFPGLKEQNRTLLALALIRHRNNDNATAAKLLAELAKSAPDAWTAHGLEQLTAKIEGRPARRSAPPGATKNRIPPVPKIKVPDALKSGK